mmetsp:Transcript_107169/g.185555  ORF Transcript_107169/g.185555 Transcript_107169/m.185555 type:complete len:385 (-) Transcript_107169:52-1206(-)
MESEQGASEASMIVTSASNTEACEAGHNQSRIREMAEAPDTKASWQTNAGSIDDQKLVLQRWNQAGLESDALLRLADFEAVQRAGANLCELRPDLPRGWLLGFVAMKELGATREDLVALLQHGLAACEGCGTVHVLKSALDLEMRNSFGNASLHSVEAARDGVSVFVGQWDAEGVYLYQAFCDEIADWALAHQHLGGPRFNTTRMTWAKPSFGWILYRSGYGHKPGQNRILKIKVPHHALAEILSHCSCVDTNKDTRSGRKAGKAEGESNGRVQWDPERDMLSADGREPRRMLRTRAIQIGLAGRLSQLYVQSAVCVQDVTELAHRICHAHRSKKNAMDELLAALPDERPYMPHCSEDVLIRLGMLPGERASALQRLGIGKAHH